ncbi:MAG: hypothetical protein VCF24_12795 [Candidatus Latescibacterota bacterium]|jgi:hypothetical protein
MQMNLRKSIFGAVLGLSMAVGFGVGATQLHASVAAAEAAACDSAQVCPLESSDACPLGTAKTSAASSCPVNRSASI